jgi:hypothetical protein
MLMMIPAAVALARILDLSACVVTLVKTLASFLNPARLLSLSHCACVALMVLTHWHLCLCHLFLSLLMKQLEPLFHRLHPSSVTKLRFLDTSLLMAVSVLLMKPWKLWPIEPQLHSRIPIGTTPSCSKIIHRLTVLQFPPKLLPVPLLA